jgi:hypothetical protein
VDMGCNSGRHLGTVPGGLRGAGRNTRPAWSSRCADAYRHCHGHRPARHPHATRLHTRDGYTFQYAVPNLACDGHTQTPRFESSYSYADADKLTHTRAHADADANTDAFAYARTNADAFLATKAYPHVHAETDAPANSSAQGDADADHLR